ncbi:hypothetical protein PM076_17790 [Halorubrum ezzemoulense]|uniref:Uncharacterized protein n=1 Tax=Halorubrum ezzemoulense TaxID=337243 RepID=A0ABT4Z612_HALEZ|nr:hypothetical protein [Halorubrum ezzemoulense]MDB2246534.1 hypothetical protein [Halorubrum ezzemoulense]MDB2280191.1 hypothetical protein [Halorubrum ezzemoulense]MDB2290620.1 hypothetical protein [Halorubrum ezzemoulense]MDB2293612.1 hypothetical protein [Halorubrum ezzemoulense]MDB2298086.1 hypothetical protein [Halorubrum ezzemoulense]
MSNAEFERTLELLAEYVEEIGDRVEEKFVEDIIQAQKSGQETSLVGHRCLDDGNRYLVAGHPDHREVNIVYFYSLIEIIETSLEEDTAIEIIEKSDVEFEDTYQQINGARQMAAEYLVARVPEDVIAAFENYLYMMVSGGTHHTEIHAGRMGGVGGFVVSSMVFPYEREFGISDFYDAVVPVVEMGRRGDKIIRQSVHLDIDEENPEQSILNINIDM